MKGVLRCVRVPVDWCRLSKVIFKESGAVREEEITEKIWVGLGFDFPEEDWSIVKESSNRFLKVTLFVDNNIYKGLL